MEKPSLSLKFTLGCVQEKQKFSESSTAEESVIVRNLGDKELIFVYTDSCAVLMGCTELAPFLGTEPRLHPLFILVCTIGQWL